MRRFRLLKDLIANFPSDFKEYGLFETLSDWKYLFLPEVVTPLPEITKLVVVFNGDNFTVEYKDDFTKNIVGAALSFKRSTTSFENGVLTITELG